MKFPSLVRLPRHQRFEIKTRYYDPVKEFVEERKAMAKESGSENTEELSVSRIRFERKKASGGLMSAALMQLIIALGLSGLVVGYLFFGNDVLYVGLILIPVYFYFRFRKK